MEWRGYTNGLFYVIQQMSCAFLRSTLQAYIYIYIFIFVHTRHRPSWAWRSHSLTSAKVTGNQWLPGRLSNVIYIYTYIPAAALTVTCFIYIYIYLDSPCIYIYTHNYVAGLKHFFTLEATPASSDQEVACIYKDARIPKIKRSTVLTIVKICNLYCTAAVCSDPAFAWQRIDCSGI